MGKNFFWGWVFRDFGGVLGVEFFGEFGNFCFFRVGLGVLGFLGWNFLGNLGNLSF